MDACSFAEGDYNFMPCLHPDSPTIPAPEVAARTEPVTPRGSALPREAPTKVLVHLDMVSAVSVSSTQKCFTA